MSQTKQRTSFLAIEGLHVLVTGAAGGIGSEAVREFLAQSCRVTALDLRPITASDISSDSDQQSRLNIVQADISSEESISSAIESASKAFGVINILIANAGVADESIPSTPIWDLPVSHWDKINTINFRGTFLTIKHFLRAAKGWQTTNKQEIPNLAIVVTGSECGKFGQENHVDYASGKAGLQYGLVPSVKNEIIRLNGKARINAVAPGWVDTPLIEGRLDDPAEMWAEAEACVALRKLAQPGDVARTMAFLASHRAAGHISGQTLSVDGGMEGRLLWKPGQTRP